MPATKRFRSLLSLRRPLLESEDKSPAPLQSEEPDMSSAVDVARAVLRMARNIPDDATLGRQVRMFFVGTNAVALAGEPDASVQESLASGGEIVLSLLDRKRHPGLAAALDAKANREGQGSDTKTSATRRPFAPVSKSTGVVTDLQESLGRGGSPAPRKVPSLRNLRRG